MRKHSQMSLPLQKSCQYNTRRFSLFHSLTLSHGHILCKFCRFLLDAQDTVSDPERVFLCWIQFEGIYGSLQSEREAIKRCEENMKRGEGSKCTIKMNVNELPLQDCDIARNTCKLHLQAAKGEGNISRISDASLLLTFISGGK